MAPVTFPPGYLRALPPLARAVLREHRRRLLGQARGRVLNLGDGSAPGGLLAKADEVVSSSAATAMPPPDSSFDTVVSVLHLAAVDDLPAELGAIGRLLAPHGRLLFLEPVRQPGWGGRAQAVLSPVVRVASGWRVDRDLPLAIRSNGWSIVDIERITMPAVVWPVRAFVLGSAWPAFKEPGEA